MRWLRWCLRLGSSKGEVFLRAIGVNFIKFLKIDLCVTAFRVQSYASRASLALKEDLVATNNHLENVNLLPKSVADLWKKRADEIKKDIQFIEQTLKKIIDDDQDLRLKFGTLKKIPGVGNETAIAVLAEVTRLENFKTARELAAFIGLTPKHRISGSSVRKKPKISKMGLKILRKALYFPAITAMKFNPSLKFFADNLREKGKKPKQIICAVMRKLVHIIFGVLKYDVPKLKIVG